MTKKKEITNDFTWSFSRHRMFNSCKRKYYYQYYGSWGGWENSAEETTKKLYMLKNITTLPMLAGDVVHKMISIVLESWKKRYEISVEKAENQIINNFRRAWRESKNCEWEKSPKWKTNLFEHYYEENPSKDRLLEIKDTLVESIHGFYLSESFDFIKTLSTQEWLSKEKMDTFDFHATKIWCVVDFAVRHTERVYIYDWKTGKKTPEDEVQLSIYALYAREKWDVDLKDLRLIDVYLKHHLSPKIKPNRTIVTKTENMINDSIFNMKELLDDEFENKASIGKFPMVDNNWVCSYCKYKEVCYPDSWKKLSK